jgi:hypothetical protein
MKSGTCPSRKLIASLVLFAALLTGPPAAAADDAAVVRGADELFWVPTLEQALEMAEVTGRPLFLMGYSLVPNGSTYTKLSEDYCSGVF